MTETPPPHPTADDDYGIMSIHSSMPSSPWSAGSQAGGIATPPSMESSLAELSRISSAEELNDDRSSQHSSAPPHMQFSDLIMPSLTLPRRRTPTVDGSRVGTLRVLVSGAPELGKTSLVKMLIEGSGDVLLAGVTPTIERPNPEMPSPSESWASTTILPPWKRGSRAFDRLNDEVIVRNLCFVELPVDKNAVISYVEEQFSRTDRLIARNIPSGFNIVDLLSTGCGGVSHVDVCLYMISPDGLQQSDIDFLKAVQIYLNIIPIVAKVDTLSIEKASDLKLDIIKDLRENGIKFFTCGHTIETLRKNITSKEPLKTPPFAVSSLGVHSNDDRGMEPSTQSIEEDNLNSFDLAAIRNVLFSTHTAWLRSMTAEKFVSWRSRQLSSLVPLSTTSSPLAPDIDSLSQESLSAHGAYPEVSTTELEQVGSRLLAQLQRLEDVRLRMQLSRHVRERRVEMDQFLVRLDENMEVELRLETKRRRKNFLQARLKECEDEREQDIKFAPLSYPSSPTTRNAPEPDPLHWSNFVFLSSRRRYPRSHKELSFAKHKRQRHDVWAPVYNAAIWCAFGAVAGVVAYTWWI